MESCGIDARVGSSCLAGHSSTKDGSAIDENPHPWDVERTASDARHPGVNADHIPSRPLSDMSCHFWIGEEASRSWFYAIEWNICSGGV